MSLEGAIYQRLRDDAGVSGQVSGRIHPKVLPERSSLPAITFERLGGTSDQTLSGPSCLEFSTISITAWAKKHADAVVLAGLIQESLDGQAFTLDGTRVKHSGKINHTDVPFDSDTRRHGITMDFDIGHLEAA